MADVTIYINGRPYEISCDNGQEGRVVDLAAYIDHRLQEIARSGGAYNDPHLLVLTALVLADELFDTREAASMGRIIPPVIEEGDAPAMSTDEESALAETLDQLAKRIDGLAARLEAA